MHTSPKLSIPDILNETFHKVDESLSHICKESDGKIHSGCTAVTAFLRLEGLDGHQPFKKTPTGERVNELQDANHVENAIPNADKSSVTEDANITTPPAGSRRVLYTANAGDARGVLCRNGQAVRLTYDHKGSDKQEAKRIVDAGGFVMSGRVNGVLAVTRSLGDPSMKEFVVGAPYTTETELCDDDEFLILACDGVGEEFLSANMDAHVQKLWDVVSDQSAVDLVRDTPDAQDASQKLLQYAISHHTTDNVTVLVVRFKHFG
jgi:protein phosphatase PTC1